MDEEGYFRSIENDYLEVSNQIKTLLPQLDAQRGAEKQKLVQRVDRLSSRADEHIKQMNMEANSIAKQDVKQRLKQRVTTYETDLRDLKQQIKVSKESTKIQINNQGRDYLLGGSSDGTAANSLMTSDDYRRQMESNTQMLKGSSSVLDQANVLLQETEETAIDAAARVKQQGEQIRGTRDRLRDVKSEIQIGGRTITRMNRTRILNSIILTVVIIVLLAIIGIILYFVIKPLVTPPKK